MNNILFLQCLKVSHLSDYAGRDISHQKQEEIKNLQELDENDLGLAHDFNKIFNS